MLPHAQLGRQAIYPARSCACIDGPTQARLRVDAISRTGAVLFGYHRRQAGYHGAGHSRRCVPIRCGSPPDEGRHEMFRETDPWRRRAALFIRAALTGAPGQMSVAGEARPRLSASAPPLRARSRAVRGRPLHLQGASVQPRGPWMQLRRPSMHLKAPSLDLKAPSMPHWGPSLEPQGSDGGAWSGIVRGLRCFREGPGSGVDALGSFAGAAGLRRCGSRLRRSGSRVR